VKRIFVIDDEAAMGENIQRMLKFPETTVTAYTDPVKGLADAAGKAARAGVAGHADAGDGGRGSVRAPAPGAAGTADRFLHGIRKCGGRGAGDAQRRLRLPAEPFKRDDLLLVVKRALAHAELKQEVERLQGRLEALGETDHPQSRSAVMRELTGKAQRAAATDATVMILGESGTARR